ncbi:ABC transporter ATP-binding protein [Deinococcus yavapaiensis]|uniref:ATP-binding cassette subfamily B protein n=1 Tax=Deinococcus yavapaiensis KR-236 TaxID=694435 RepID=A0A318S9G4_9DEIO|nr:ABC transporter ATP-binding protein [Deinococcus yavapaiensis]PYE53671.1 ATP-binding cassette subfamily B protein [Deinococcus yavapaiensis KR-236]
MTVRVFWEARWAPIGRLVRRTALTLWSAQPRLAVSFVLILIVRGGMAPLSLWLIKGLVDAISHGHAADTVRILLVLGVAVLATQVLHVQSLLLQASLNERFTAHVELMLMRHANRVVDLRLFEDPAFHDRLQLLSRQAGQRPMGLLAALSNLLPSALTTVGLLGLLGWIVWWAPLLLVLGAVPLGQANARLQRASWQMQLERSGSNRSMRYFSGLAVSEAHAKEIRLYGLAEFFEQRYVEAFERSHADALRQRRRLLIMPLLAACAFVAVNGITFAWVTSRALSGELGIGVLVLALQVLVSLLVYVGGVAGSLGVLRGHLHFFQELFGFLDQPATLLGQANLPVPPSPWRDGLEFERVSYHYPEGQGGVFDLTFTLRHGERVAIVGENGAGKTTLLKLLCRFMDPSSGTIRVNGRPLADIDVEAWRSRIAAVLQDFGRYHLSVSENIGLGDVQHRTDEARVSNAARRARLHEDVEGLPSGYATLLGVSFGGMDFSGGQWQKLGVARAFMREADVVLFDEPTSALDARAEADLFERVEELSDGKIVVIVTHRLASIRSVDRILVLQRGQLVEQGTHAELMARRGEYARLYELQASRYTPNAP